MTSRRPETFDDLANWERTETLADFALTPDGMKAGLLAGINGVITAFTANSTREQPVTVECVDGSIVIHRPRPNIEVARRFEAAQARWDREHPPRDQALMPDPEEWPVPRAKVPAELLPTGTMVDPMALDLPERHMEWPGLPSPVEDTAVLGEQNQVTQ